MAARVAAELAQRLGLEVSLVVGSAGEFTVWLDGTKVSEKQQGRFPKPEDVVAAVRAALP